MARTIKSILSDPRYPGFVKRYRYDWVKFCVEMIGKKPTHQQRQIIESAQEIGSLTSVSSGHGVGKSDLTASLILAYLICFPKSEVAVLANKIDQVRTVVWKYLKVNFKELCKREPWIEQYFVLTETALFERAHKGVWQATPKSARQGNEEAVAGMHNKHLFIICDEASGIGDRLFGVLNGALTEKDNRFLLLSQPTRPAGYFYDTHHSLAKPRGDWNAITLNSEESPLVTVDFIRRKRLEYNGVNNPEYQIKVRGQFPKSLAGFLLSRDDVDKAARTKPTMDQGWGWIACCDVGNGRDKSIMNIVKVCGQRNERKVLPYKLVEMDGNVDPVRFADIIFAECSEDRYRNITIVVDSDGVGYDTATCLERKGMRVQRIRWGKRMFSTSDKMRFINQRAYANIFARDAIVQGRMGLDANLLTLEQAAKIPCGINEQGQWAMMPKKLMKEKLNISSPDRWDTYCFTQLAHYVPANVVMTKEAIESRGAVEDWLKEALDEV
ncbi:terminase [Photobacterium leiognathi]|uniref:terminase n=1 Tax=Photobacterium leiognathi TaxID=553611 RepID=UPI00298204A7|nr:terminase [Photobacterium leiognathi]